MVCCALLESPVAKDIPYSGMLDIASQVFANHFPTALPHSEIAFHVSVATVFAALLPTVFDTAHPPRKFNNTSQPTPIFAKALCCSGDCHA